MIRLSNVSKVYDTRGGPLTVLRNVEFVCEPGERIAILGANGGGKSTLLRIVAGVSQPTAGTVERRMSTSWPLGFGGAFHGALTGRDNVKFIARIYGVPADPVLDEVMSFSELGRFIDEPVKTYSSGMRARLAFGLTLAIDFECILIDEVVAVGDSRFREKSERRLFGERTRDRAMIVISHDTDYLQRHCKKAYLVWAGNVVPFARFADAADEYRRLMASMSSRP